MVPLLPERIQHMRQCYVCGEMITEPASAYARNICRRCATAPAQEISHPAASPKDDNAGPLPPTFKRSRLPPPANQQSLRGAASVVVGGILDTYSILTLL